MNPRPFIALAAAVVIFGASLGASFAAGAALGRNQASSDDAPAPQQPIAPGAVGTEAGSSISQEDASRLQGILLSGQEPSPADVERLRQSLGQRGAAGFSGVPGTGLRPGQGLTGTIESVDDDGAISLSTAQGAVQARIGDDTRIQGFVTVDVADLEPGAQVTVAGQRAADGTLEVDAILIIPEDGLPGLFGANPGFLAGPGASRPGASSDNSTE